MKIVSKEEGAPRHAYRFAHLEDLAPCLSFQGCFLPSSNFFILRRMPSSMPKCLHRQHLPGYVFSSDDGGSSTLSSKVSRMRRSAPCASFFFVDPAWVGLPPAGPAAPVSTSVLAGSTNVLRLVIPPVHVTPAHGELTPFLRFDVICPSSNNRHPKLVTGASSGSLCVLFVFPHTIPHRDIVTS